MKQILILWPDLGFLSFEVLKIVTTNRYFGKASPCEHIPKSPPSCANGTPTHFVNVCAPTGQEGNILCEHFLFYYNLALPPTGKIIPFINNVC